MAMLEVTNLGISFGGLRAVDELSMKFPLFSFQITFFIFLD